MRALITAVPTFSHPGSGFGQRTPAKQMDVILLQLLNGLDKGGAYALIALG
jgi:hypothetical protein